MHGRPPDDLRPFYQLSAFPPRPIPALLTAVLLATIARQAHKSSTSTISLSTSTVRLVRISGLAHAQPPRTLPPDCEP